MPAAAASSGVRSVMENCGVSHVVGVVPSDASSLAMHLAMGILE